MHVPERILKCKEDKLQMCMMLVVSGSFQNRHQLNFIVNLDSFLT